MSTTDYTGGNRTDSSSETLDDVKEELSQVSQEGAEAAREVAESRFEQGREATTEQLDSASDAMNEVAAKLEENDSPFASYATELSGQLSSFSEKLSTSSIDDLVSGARSLARDNPAAFMLGSMAIGLAASRFFKVTGEQVAHQSNGSTAPSVMSHDERTGAQYHEHATTGMPGSTGVEPSRARSTAAGIAGPVTPSISKPVNDRGNPGIMSDHANAANHSGRTTREEV